MQIEIGKYYQCCPICFDKILRIYNVKGGKRGTCLCSELSNDMYIAKYCDICNVEIGCNIMLRNIKIISRLLNKKRAIDPQDTQQHNKRQKL